MVSPRASFRPCRIPGSCERDSTDLVLGEGSVTALVSENPETHADASGREPVDVPEGRLEEQVRPVRKRAREGRGEGSEGEIGRG